MNALPGSSRWSPFPRTLLWRTFLLITLLMLLSALAWYYIFTTFEREPRARQTSQLLVSLVNLSRSALITARPDARHELLREMSDREGIHIYAAEIDDRVAPLPDRPFLNLVQRLVRAQLGDETRMSLERNGEKGLFVSFRIDEGEDSDTYWLALPRDRLERTVPQQWLGWGAAALALALAGAWLIMFRVTRPLKALARAAADIGRGHRPQPVPTHGPAEIETLAHSFNQMNADLARLDEDRALILAGISHDLRTPLTRLRMGIELSADDSLREGMIADVEEMDRTIGQFLDFARTEEANEGEAAASADLAALLEDLAGQYRKRGADLRSDLPAACHLPMRIQALRRAVANLIDNALRYAGSEQPLELALSADKQLAVVEVRDRGPGIPPEDAERLKLPFTRLEKARTDTMGAGLGLAIVDRIARSHGGRFDLLPRPGGGLIARLTLPLRG